MLKFVGDINLTDWDFNFGFGIGSRIGQGFDPFAKFERSDDDIWIGNFEGVASDVTNRKGYAASVFRVSPSVLNRLHHFDIYGFANNHAMQHGEEAYIQTWDSLQAQGCKMFGKKDSRSIYFWHQGKCVALTGCCFRIDEFTTNPSYWYNPEYKEIEEEITKLPDHSFKVFFVHWGNEFINRPSSQQIRFAHWLIDAGFDLIIGTHPHVLQGFEDYKGKRIYYSLGNFVFDMVSDSCKYGAIVTVDISGDRPSFSNDYIIIDKTCSPTIVEKETVPNHLKFEFLNDLLKKVDNSEEYHNEINKGYLKYRRINRRHILRQVLLHPKVSLMIIGGFIQRRLLSQPNASI